MAPGRLWARLAAAVRMARPYSLLWFVTAPTVTMALLVGDGRLAAGRVALLVAAFACTDAGLTSWNDLCDRETDRLSTESQRNARPLVAGVISPRWARWQVLVLEACGVAAAFALSGWFGLLLGGGVLFGLGYSARPTYMGGRPLVSQGFWIVLWPAMYGGVVLALGEGSTAAGWLYVAGAVAFMGVGETLAKDLRDLENDTSAGKRTTPVAFGVDRSAVPSLVMFAVGSGWWLAAAAVAEPATAALPAALAVVLALWVGRAAVLVRGLLGQYTKAHARDLHVGAIRVFLTINLLFLAGLHR